MVLNSLNELHVLFRTFFQNVIEICEPSTRIILIEVTTLLFYLIINDMTTLLPI
jgi:hypothetical protein